MKTAILYLILAAVCFIFNTKIVFAQIDTNQFKSKTITEEFFQKSKSQLKKEFASDTFALRLIRKYKIMQTLRIIPSIYGPVLTFFGSVFLIGGLKELISPSPPSQGSYINFDSGTSLTIAAVSLSLGIPLVLINRHIKYRYDQDDLYLELRNHYIK